MAINLPTYKPDTDQLQQFEILLTVCKQANSKNLNYWLTGGYAYDAMLGRLTRDHGDFDFFVAAADDEPFSEIIEAEGFILKKRKYKEDTDTTLCIYYRDELKLEYVLVKLTKHNVIFGKYKFLRSEFPNTPLGKLKNVPIKVPTLNGHQKLDSIVDRDNYAHLQHRQSLIAAIKQ